MATNLLPTPVLRARRAELFRARMRLDVELERLSAALRARDPNSRPSPAAARHGTESGYITHRRRWGTPPCDPCKTAHAEEQAAYRARLKARTTEGKTTDE